MKATLAIFATLVLAGCTHTIYKPIVLTSTCPDAPTLPKITAQELASVSDRTYNKLVARELAMRQYIATLEINCDRK